MSANTLNLLFYFPSTLSHLKENTWNKRVLMNFTRKVRKSYCFSRTVLNAACYEDRHLLRMQHNSCKSVEERITDCFDASRWLSMFSTAKVPQ